jgi:Tol biopolymer transport system component
MNRRLYFLIGFALFLLACNFGIESPTPTTNLLATLAASTPLGGDQPISPTNANEIPTSSVSVETSLPFTPTALAPGVTAVIVDDQPPGKIVFTCQIFKITAMNQICIINADGTGFRRLTTDDNKQHYYPSLSSDGKSMVYAAFLKANYFEIYEMELLTGNIKQLTNLIGNVNAPEISPDGKYIVFKKWNPNLNMDALYIMDRVGENIDRFTKIAGWDPTWSPDGKSILFASDVGGDVQLYSSQVDGNNLHRISNLPAIRGRSDWSPDGQSIVTYSGGAWQREVYIMNADGSGARVLSPTGGNAQGPAFSPDSKWVAFTAYYDHPGDDHGCEIYIIRTDGTDLRRLTDNDYCDYQPRWGP